MSEVMYGEDESPMITAGQTISDAMMQHDLLCNLCGGKSFHSKEQKKKHIQWHFEMQERNIFRVLKKITDLDTDVNNSNKNMILHENNIYILDPLKLKGLPLSCRKCELFFNFPNEWIEHIKHPHSKKTKNSSVPSVVTSPQSRFPNSPFSCYICEHSFEDVDQLTNHLASHDANQVAQHLTSCKEDLFTKKCRVMSVESNNAEFHANNYQIQCHLCNRVFTRDSDLFEHLKTHQTSISIKENTSARKRGRKSLNPDHVPTYSKPSMCCGKCSRFFSSSDELQKHVEVVHMLPPSLIDTAASYSPIILPDKKINVENVCVFPCPFCQLKFGSESGLNSHVSIVHRPQVSPSPTNNFCTECGQHFENISDYSIHYASVHVNASASTNISCQFCGDSFATQDAVDRHIASHHII